MLGIALNCFLICLLLLSQAPQQPLPAAHDSGLHGRVVDSYEHASIRNAYVLAHRNGNPDSQGNPDSHVRTDYNGKYAMALPEGIYDVFISADGFSPTSRKIEVTPDGMMIFDAALEFNGLGMEQD
jgi:hypothetical protein